VKRDTGLDVLLDLHGTEYTEECGYWYRIEAWLVDPSPQRPHGIRYNLTLDNNFNQRILGFDNAQATQTSKKYSGQIVEFDHVHASINDKGTPYRFKNAEQLLQDFFEAIEQVLNAL